MCKCGDFCFNRLVQNGVTVALCIFVCSDDRGFGIRTLEDLVPGEFVCEYAGEVLSFDEARKRTRQQSQNAMNYIIGVKEYSNDHEQTIFIDPKRNGNVGRFINHSCDPNLIMIPVRVNSEVPSLALFAKRKILAGEELSFHYGGNSPTSSEPQKSAKPCFCESFNCSGYLPYDPTLL